MKLTESHITICDIREHFDLTDTFAGKSSAIDKCAVNHKICKNIIRLLNFFWEFGRDYHLVRNVDTRISLVYN